MIPKVNDHILDTKKEPFIFSQTYINIQYDSFSDSCTKVFLERTNLNRKDDVNGISLIKNKSYAPEEYKISISSDVISITAATDNGVILALTTLYQMIKKNGEVPAGIIYDNPRYSHRGLSFDCARHFFSVDEVKSIIEQMSLVKMNVLHWHLTDDQAWRIESKKFPKLHEQHGNNYYSHEDIREIVSYAMIRGIEVIPEVDMPGHATALLAAYPEYSCSGKQVKCAECGGIYPIILCAGEEKTYQLIEMLFDEICPLFTAEKFHIGGDEAPKKEWKACPKCQKAIRKNNLANETELQGYFNNRVIEILKKHEKKMVCWNDSLEAANLDSDAIIQFWTVNFEKEIKPFTDKGGKFIYSDMFTYYLDYPHAMTSLKRLYEDTISIDGIDYSDSPALLGIEACIWSEHLIDTNSLETRIFPRLYAAAEVMWSRERNYEDFENRLKYFMDMFHPGDMAAVSESGWNPKGNARQKEAFAYMSKINSAMSPEVHAETVESSAPNESFHKKFVECFFEPCDLPILMQSMSGGSDN